MRVSIAGILVAVALATGVDGRARSAGAGDVVVMTSGAFTAAHLQLAAAFERRDGSRIVTAATSMGTGDTSIEARLERGEAADVVIVDADALDRFIAKGLVAGGSRIDLARSSVGMAVRHGAPKPDISTVEAFTRALLDAPSIAYSASVSGTYLTTELFQTLGVADRVLPKSRRIVGERVGAVVARGEAAIGFQQMSELLPVPGIDIVGPLPAALQRVTVFAAGLGTSGRNLEVARRYLAFVSAPESAGAIAATGMEPLARKAARAARTPGPEPGSVGTILTVAVVSATRPRHQAATH